MLPFAIPPGTTLEKLVTEVVPSAHGRLVPRDAGREPLTCAFELEGLSTWVISLDGSSMTVRPGEEKAPEIRICVRGTDAQAFLDDWMGPQRFVPKVKPPSDLVLMSDPRVLKRVRLVTGKIELAIRDFDDGQGVRRVAISVAVGTPAKKVDPDPDVVLETSMKTYLRLLSAELGPEDALADGDVSITGKRLVAMQFAFAIAPLFPRPAR